MSAVQLDLIAALLGRPVASGQETTFATALWAMAERRVLVRVPMPTAVLPDVLAAVVARVLRNPGGLRSEADGDYSYSRLGDDPTLLEPLAAEWRLLRPFGSGAFTVDPTPVDAGYLPSFPEVQVWGDEWGYS